MNPDSGIIRISVFYDGTFFSKITNFYKYNHSRKSHLTFTGLHEFVRHKIAEKEQTEVGYLPDSRSSFFPWSFLTDSC